MGFRHTVWYYIKRNTCDSLCLTLAFIIGAVSLAILIVFYALPSLYIPVSWSEERINNVNNLIVTLSSGYLVTYVSYFLTITIPTAVKTQYKRVCISEDARSLQDRTYDFLNGLCDFCDEQRFINEDNIERFLELNCYGKRCNQYYQLKADSKRFIKNFIEDFKQQQRLLEENLDYLYSKERKCLAGLVNAKMWNMLNQQFYGDSILFKAEQYKNLLNQILHYHQLAIQLYEELNDGKYNVIEEEINRHIQKRPNRIYSFISITNINHNN